MTSVGRFSLKSETEANRSIPTFFLALSGAKKIDGKDHTFSPQKIFTISDFENCWLERDMPRRHPRFHSTVCPEQQFFEETHQLVSAAVSSRLGVENEDDDEATLQIKAELDRHASETVHYSAYREDLRQRLEKCLTEPLEVSDKLWEVKISNGLLGSSGAISKVKCDAIRKRKQPQISQSNISNVLKRYTTKGGTWKDAVEEVEGIPLESVLLFRSHHALADGASIMAALSDLCDEAEEIRADIEMKLKKIRGEHGRRKNLIRRLMSRLVRLLKMCLWLSFGSLAAFAYQGYLQITTWENPFDVVRKNAEKKGLAVTGRSISWCDAVPLDEVKRVANIIGKARGVIVTVNDVFVSCATSAVTRQLIEHEKIMAPFDGREHKRFAPQNINVVVPVHLRGGIVLPDESIGNNIGAFVTQCPGDIKGSTERLHRVHKSLLYSKRSPAPLVSNRMAKFCSDYLPEDWTKAIFQRANANACLSE